MTYDYAVSTGVCVGDGDCQGLGKTFGRNVSQALAFALDSTCLPVLDWGNAAESL